jgi:putative addiction module antidote
MKAVTTVPDMPLEIKLRRIGNSVGFVLPKEALAHLNLREGAKVCVTKAADGSLRLASANNAEFSRQMEIAKDVMQRYRHTLRELAK